MRDDSSNDSAGTSLMLANEAFLDYLNFLDDDEPAGKKTLRKSIFFVIVFLRISKQTRISPLTLSILLAAN